MQPISIFILGEHALTRQGLAFTLEADFKVVGQSGINEHAIQTITRKKPKIILLDVRAFDTSVVETIEKLASFSTQSRLVILYPAITSAIYWRMITLKVAGILTKNISLFELKQAIKTIVNCNFFVCSDPMIQSTADKAMQHTSLEVLSRYETELIKFISNGMTSKQIGQQLNISYRTISTHRYKLMKKLDAKNMAELVRFASPNGIAIKE